MKQTKVTQNGFRHVTLSSLSNMFHIAGFQWKYVQITLYTSKNRIYTKYMFFTFYGYLDKYFL